MLKPIKNFPNYLISDDGNIYSKVNDIYLKNHKNNRGYIVCQIRNKTQKCIKSIHRLVAEAFIENPLNLPEVNHKDGNKLNNNMNNLEWCTRKENIQHAIKNNLSPQLTSENVVKQYDKNGNLIKVWKSTTEIERTLGYFHGNISRCCNGIYKKAYGYIWKYEGVETNRDECNG